MGLYIPPGSGGSNSSSSSQGKNTVSSGDNDRGSSNKTVFYTRPSVGLKLWGPLVPASDCLPCIYTLTALQTALGLTMFVQARNVWNKTNFSSRLTRLLCVLGGTYTIFNSGLEMSRLILPYDPWYEEAKAARSKAKTLGKDPNFWFGPVDYKPMSFKDWSAKVERWVEETESSEQGTFEFSVQNPEFHTMYLKIRDLNRMRSSGILQSLSKTDVNDFLPNLRNFVNPEFDRPPILVPQDNNLETDLDFLEVWELNNPWDLLGADTDIIVKFIPKFRWISTKPQLIDGVDDDDDESPQDILEVDARDHTN